MTIGALIGRLIAGSTGEHLEKLTHLKKQAQRLGIDDISVR